MSYANAAHLVGLFRGSPVGVVPLGRVEVPLLNVDYGPLHRPAQLRVLVVEVLQGLAELVPVPEPDDDDAVLSSQLLHLILHRAREEKKKGRAKNLRREPQEALYEH